MIQRGRWPKLRLCLLPNNTMSVRCFRVMAWLCLALWAVGGRPGTTDEVHYFVDERGVPHFSNVPADPRYRYFLRSTAAPGLNSIADSPPAAPRFNSTADPPATSIFAPPIVEKGSEFVVNVILANSDRIHGWLGISFDPAAISFKDANVRYDLPAAGQIRLDVHGDPAKGFSADLQFRAEAPASPQTSISQTSVSLTQASLTTEDGEPTFTTPSATSIAVRSAD